MWDLVTLAKINDRYVEHLRSQREARRKDPAEETSSGARLRADSTEVAPVIRENRQK